MSNHGIRPAGQHPTQPAARPASINRSAGRPATQTSTDRPTATYPTGCPSADYLDRALPGGWRADPRPSRYLDPTDPRLVQADATPTGVFPARRSIRPAGQAGQAWQGTDAATTARTRPGTHAWHTSAQPSTRPEQPPFEPSPAVQDMGRPGVLARPSMAWHPSLMQLAIGAALVLAIIGACNVAAIQAHREARAYCHTLVASDWDRAARECRGTGAGTPVPEQVPTAPAQSEQVPAEQPSTPASPASPSSKAVWTVHGTDAPYDRTDPTASPLDLPRCTTAPDTPMPCLAHISADSHHATVLEEDASLTGLDRR